jgi:transcriptional regulator with XRE-family HTH domain
MLYSTHLLRHLRLTIGRNINQRRLEKKLPLVKLARLTGVPEANLDRYELGKSEIRLDEMLKIACALEVPVGALVEV